MSSSLRPRTVPLCTACLRRYAFAPFVDAAAPVRAWGQQVRGKKKMVNNSRTVAVRLLKDVKTYGQKGALIPLVRGQMRNIWFPRGLASYITAPELKTIRAKDIPIQRDFSFGVTKEEVEVSPPGDAITQSGLGSSGNAQSARATQKSTASNKISPQRSAELLEIFVPARLDFYRQPIPEERKKEDEDAETSGRFEGAADILLVARKNRHVQSFQPIYGSVVLLDVLDSMRAALRGNDEARRVVLHEDEIAFVDLPPKAEGSDAHRIKHLGEFQVAVRLKGVETEVRRTVRVQQRSALGSAAAETPLRERTGASDLEGVEAA